MRALPVVALPVPAIEGHLTHEAVGAGLLCAKAAASLWAVDGESAIGTVSQRTDAASESRANLFALPSRKEENRASD